jgi:uncharacterized protein with von Willebrand factor type A (vWA) domain
MMLLDLLYNLRSQGLRVGTTEWLDLLRGLAAGLVDNVDGLYYFARARLIHDESHYDAFDLAFSETMQGRVLPPKLKDELQDWLAQAIQALQEERVEIPQQSLEELLRELEKRLQEQTERHDGGSYWIGTGGTSPFGHSGRAKSGIRIGGSSQGRGAVQVAEQRQWASYRSDTLLEIRDFQRALSLVRQLAREGEEVLDIEQTIHKTAASGGELEIAMQREKSNKVHFLLLMDVGGSMTPYQHLVSRLFTAASQLKTFKSFDYWHFHNCPYGWLYKDFRSTHDRKATVELLASLTPQHRIVWVGDASMAPWELFSSGAGFFGNNAPPGIENIRAFARKTKYNVWLNPDPPRHWEHPTVQAIGAEIPMFSLTLDGVKQAVRQLKRGKSLG